MPKTVKSYDKEIFIIRERIKVVEERMLSDRQMLDRLKIDLEESMIARTRALSEHKDNIINEKDKSD